MADTSKQTDLRYTASLAVVESDGYVGHGGSESVYREDAFSTAADTLGIDYDLIYLAWVNQIPMEVSA
jgi:hypothetical protein